MKNAVIVGVFLVAVALLYLMEQPRLPAWHSSPESAATAPQSRSGQSDVGVATVLTPTAVASAVSTPPAKQARSKEAGMQAVWDAENSTPLDFYGRVVDQFGVGISGAKIKGSVTKIGGFDRSPVEEFWAESDTAGNFEFHGLRGTGLGIWPQKAGYSYNLKQPSARPKDYKVDPANRIRFVMWKLDPPRQMSHVEVNYGAACDGSPLEIDLATGDKVAAGGDLIVRLTRDPVDIVRGRRFNWSITIGVPSGGLRPIEDIYGFEAPAEGYQTEIRIDMPTNRSDWTETLAQPFYFKARGGQFYGRFVLNVTADYQPPPTYVGIDEYFNPACSRNLETTEANVTTLIAPQAASELPARPLAPPQTNRTDANTAAETEGTSKLPKAPASPKGKAEQMREYWAQQNAASQDFYGKVVDQAGNPVSGATVLGTLLWIQGFDVGEKREQHTTETDAKGEFEFTGFHASRLAVAVTKTGYQMDQRGAAYKAPNAENKTSASNRAEFTLWKLKGPESIVHSNVHAYVPCDGTATTYRILSGQKAPDGNLVITMTRRPVDIERGKPFDWSATVAIKDGGLVPISDTYPNEAPEGGYKSTIAIDMPANRQGWDLAYQRAYYFKSGQLYGRMTVSIQADFQPPPTSFDVEIYTNPSGSRNLEIDPKKLIER